MTRAGPTSSLLIVGLIVFIDMMGIGLIVPVMPDLLQQLTGRGLDRAAEIGGWLLFAYAVMQFLFAPVIGGLSDRFGRRPVLLLTLALLGVDYAIMAWAPTLAWLFLGRILSGIMGASWAAANSCVADVARPEDRGRVFGMLGGLGAFGFVVGPAIGGLLGSIDLRLPFLVAAVVALLGAAAGYFLLEETLPVEKRRKFTLARANPLGTLREMARLPVVFAFLVVILLMQLAAQSQMTVWAYYNSLKFDWNELEIGLSVALFGVMLALVQGVATGKVIARLGPQRTAVLGLVFGLPTYLLFAFAAQSWWMIAGVVLGALSGISFPAMQQMMTERVDEDAQGELQGAIASVVSITSIVGPLIMSQAFGAYADAEGLFFPGAPFLLAFLFLLVAFLLQIRAVRMVVADGRQPV